MGDEFYESAYGTVKLQLLLTDLSGQPVKREPPGLLTAAQVEALRRVPR